MPKLTLRTCLAIAWTLVTPFPGMAAEVSPGEGARALAILAFGSLQGEIDECG